MATTRRTRQVRTAPRSVARHPPAPSGSPRARRPTDWLWPAETRRERTPRAPSVVPLSTTHHRSRALTGATPTHPPAMGATPTTTPPAPVTWITNDWALVRTVRRTAGLDGLAEFLVYVDPDTGAMACQCQCVPDGRPVALCGHEASVQRAVLVDRPRRDRRQAPPITAATGKARDTGLDRATAAGAATLCRAATGGRRWVGSRDLESAYHQDKMLVHALVHHPSVTHAQVQQIVTTYPTAWCVRALLALPPIRQRPTVVIDLLQRLKPWQITAGTWAVAAHWLPAAVLRAHWRVAPRDGRDPIVAGLALLPHAEAARVVPDVLTACDLAPYLRHAALIWREAAFRLLAHVGPRGQRMGRARAV